jgi:1-acyl-sn-glycerol-3-phosphate acyltransferase
MADGSGLRVAVSPYLFRGMMVAMAGVAVTIHRTTGSKKLAWQFAKARSRDLCDLLGLEITLTGLEHIQQGGPFVYAPNHQSHLDILSLLGFLPGHTRFATKSSLWKHPVVGAVLDTLGMIPIDRDRPELAIQYLNQKAGGDDALVIFPEGTRSRDGRLAPFKKGAFVVAIELQRPIVPVVCRGTRRLMPKGSRMAVVPGPIEIVIEPPIPTVGLTYDDREALAAQVRTAIERHHTGF